MRLERCSHGHYYDAEKYAVCPHCNGEFDGEGYDTLYPNGGSQDHSNGDREKTFPINQGYAPDTEGEGVTVGALGYPQNNPSGSVVQSRVRTENAQNYPTEFGEIDAEEEDGKTVPVYPLSRKDGQSGFVQKKSFSPVVGWLVCVEGVHLGKSFPLFAGKNFIGRSASMDVCLEKDLSISRNKHAIIVFEPMHRMYFAQPGEGHELFYVNDNVILASTPLKDRDMICIGNIKLVFVPFCNDKFGWDDIQQPEDE